MEHEIELPGGIKQGETLVTSVKLREVSGYEEDILADSRKDKKTGKAKISGIERLTKVLARCTVELGSKREERNLSPEKASPDAFESAWRGALAGDRGKAIIELRRLSLGDTYRFKQTCPKCRHEMKNLSVDLGTLETTPYHEYLFEGLVTKDDDGDPLEGEELEEMEQERTALEAQRQALLLKGQYDVELPAARSRVTLKLMDGVSEDKLANLQAENEDRLVTAAMQLQVLAINGETTKLAKTLRGLSGMDRTFLRQELDKLSGGIDTDIEIVCDNPDCGQEFSQQLNLGDHRFFFPSEI